MVDRSPVEEMFLLALSPTNMNSVSLIMQNPLREIADIQLKAIESLSWGLLATEGDVTRLPAALGAMALERIEDPAKMIKIIITNGIKKGGV
jgi:hypothetical protein